MVDLYLPPAAVRAADAIRVLSPGQAHGLLAFLFGPVAGPLVALIVLDAHRRLLGVFSWVDIEQAGLADRLAGLTSQLGAQAVVLANYRPGLDLVGDSVDETSWETVVEAADRCEVEVLDWLVVAGPRWRSLLEPADPVAYL